MARAPFGTAVRHWPNRTRGLLWIVLFVSAACVSLQWKPLSSRRVDPVLGAEWVGADECSVCHEEVKGHEQISGYHAQCETCHGFGSEHADSEAVGDIRFPSSGDCLQCHREGYATHLEWNSGEHARAGVLCSDCHDPHVQERKHLRTPAVALLRDADPVSQMCAQCHRDVAAQLRYPSHHPVREGAVGCLDCHDPHADRRLDLADPNATCAGCHQDVAGPWIYEHPPVEDGCTTCHAPHGAPTRDLLSTPQPVLCLSCHPINDLWHHDVPGTGIASNATISSDYPSDPNEQVQPAEANPFLNRCNDCHGAVHGSYTDEHLRH